MSAYTWAGNVNWAGGVSWALGVGEIAEVISRAQTQAPDRRTAFYPSTSGARFAKEPGELLDFDLDFGEEMSATNDSGAADNTVTVQVLTQATGGVSVVAAYWVPSIRRVKVWISGGTNLRRYECKALLNTTGGRRLEFDFSIKVKD